MSFCALVHVDRQIILPTSLTDGLKVTL